MRHMTRRRFLQYGLGAGTALAVPWPALKPRRESRPGRQACEVPRARAAPGRGDRRGHARADPTRTRSARPRSRAAPSRPAADTAVGLRRWLRARGSGRLVRDGGRGAERHTAHRALHARATRTYPAWIPVDTRLTPLGNEVRLMTHLHGGFVAADSDGNPAVTPNGFGPGETPDASSTPTSRRRCRPRSCGSTTTAWAPPA